MQISDHIVLTKGPFGIALNMLFGNVGTTKLVALAKLFCHTIKRNKQRKEGARGKAFLRPGPRIQRVERRGVMCNLRHPSPSHNFSLSFGSLAKEIRDDTMPRSRGRQCLYDARFFLAAHLFFIALLIRMRADADK